MVATEKDSTDTLDTCGGRSVCELGRMHFLRHLLRRPASSYREEAILHAEGDGRHSHDEDEVEPLGFHRLHKCLEHGALVDLLLEPFLEEHSARPEPEH